MKSFGALLCLACLAPAAPAALTVGNSLEWLCEYSDAMGIYNVASNSVTAAVEGGRQRWTCALRLTESLKGNPPKEAKAEFSAPAPAVAAAGDSVRAGDEVLLCFQARPTGSPSALNLINLTRPWHAGADYVALNTQFEVLLDKQQILEIVRARLQAGPPAPAPADAKQRGYLVQMPSNSPAAKALACGGAGFLLVPDASRPAAGRREIGPPRDQRVIIQDFEVRDLPLDLVLTQLAEASVRADEGKVGVTIVNLTQEPLRSTRVTMVMHRTSVRGIIDVIAGTVGLAIRSSGDTIEVRPAEKPVAGETKEKN